VKRDALVILSKQEQEYLLHAIESVLPVRESHQFFRWSQGPLQTLLPHQLMVSLQFDAQDTLLHSACWHSGVLDAPLRARLCRAHDGLVPRLARRCRDGVALPAMHDTSADIPAAASENALPNSPANPLANSLSQPLAAFDAELRQLGLGNVIVHGTERLPGGSSFFALFGAPHALRGRHAYFLELLLPYLHLAMQRMDMQAGAGVGALARPVSAREMQILHWVREGKSNDEIGQILGISGLTVKNHLQRLYRVLGVSNRTHAITRCNALRLLDQAPPARMAQAA